MGAACETITFVKYPLLYQNLLIFWYNKGYLKDLSRKIKANFEIRQKETGLITKVPFSNR